MVVAELDGISVSTEGDCCVVVRAGSEELARLEADDREQTLPIFRGAHNVLVQLYSRHASVMASAEVSRFEPSRFRRTVRCGEARRRPRLPKD